MFVLQMAVDSCAVAGQQDNLLLVRLLFAYQHIKDIAFLFNVHWFILLKGLIVFDTISFPSQKLTTTSTNGLLKMVLAHVVISCSLLYMPFFHYRYIIAC